MSGSPRLDAATGRRAGRPFGLLIAAALAVLPAASTAFAQDAPAGLDGEIVAANPTLELARELTGPPAGRPLEGEELIRITDEVTALMRCPVCQGLSVADSPTASALAMKEEARQLLAAGFTGDQVLAYFERSYGEFIRLSPKPEGFNLVVWVLPVLVLLLGAAVIGVRMKSRARLASEPPGESPSDPTGDPEELAEYLARVREEAGE